ncbi:Isopenicillin N synthase [Parasponia andersonii]|uniref:Isopenicillin N synthase n=1 Tax=Parasponia andersonii TaxID=3476 RepID=A0A2P5B2Z8_PARAD|nr:Isopenicillin N synthase [Parasponia andersonii]
MIMELLKLSIVDLSSPDHSSTANFIQQACREHGFFYVVNHGVEEELLESVFGESKKLFALPLEKKLKLGRKEHRGYTPLFAENLDPDSASKTGDPKESYYIGPLEDHSAPLKLNQWPPQEILPSWRPTVETFYWKVMCAGKRLLRLIALALNLEENFFEKVGGLDKPTAFLRLLHYPGELGSSDEDICAASAHSDYGMITLLATDGVQGLQICREKFKQPRVWEDVLHIDGALIVNIGDLMERWTNCFFRSTLHRVIPVGQDRYSAAFFLDPKQECLVECLESCCSESSPPRFPPIISGDYLKERLRLAYGSGLESIG